MTEEESEVFEISDFTTSSEWERFTSVLEDILREWNEADIVNECVHDLKFAETKLLLTYYHFKEEPNKKNESKLQSIKNRYKEHEYCPLWLTLMDDSNDFSPKEHYVQKWFGINKFVILTPQTNAIDTEGKAKILLSSISFALSQLSSSLPVLVQLDKARRHLFKGVAFPLQSVHTEFDTIHLRKIPARYQCAQGIVDLLKEHTMAKSDCFLSIRFTYSFSEWPQIMCDELPEIMRMDDGVNDNDNDEDSWRTLPWGACVEVISELRLLVQWPNLLQDLFSDTTNYSDLDPLSAPWWCVRLRYIDNPECLLSSHLKQYYKLLQDSSSSSLITSADQLDNSSVGSVLDKLTEHSVPSFGTVVSKAAKRLKVHTVNSPLTERLLHKLLDFLFPDSSEENVSMPTELTDNFETDKKLKSAPVGGFLWRLTIVVLNINNSFGGKTAVNHLWNEIVLELRYRWEEGKLLPIEKDKEPDSCTCLLQQKLQMLNCCIEHRMRRQDDATAANNLLSETNELDEEDEDEFFECTDVVSKEQREANLSRPEGRLRKIAFRLQRVPEEFIYVPITQEPAPLTDDALEEQAQILASLGTNETSLRARMQSACLLSDMQAFKAANPGCILEDFVRWYSPRDITDTGNLSNRMLVEGNLWQETWNEAKSISVRKQKRLFDDRKEAEKVLHWMSNLKSNDLARELIPVLLHICMQNMEPTKFNSKIINTSRMTEINMNLIDEMFRYFQNMEIHCARRKSLQIKLKAAAAYMEEDKEKEEEEWKEVDKDVEKFCNELLDNNQVQINGGSKSKIGKLILKIFNNTDNDANKEKNYYSLPQPIAKEYIARCQAEIRGRTLPQRIYAFIGDECRMTSVWSKDTTFY